MKYLLFGLMALLLSSCSEQPNKNDQHYSSNSGVLKLVRSYYEPLEPTENTLGIIVLGGSEGGMDVARATASSLSRSNIGAMAVAYFGMDHLPERLEAIPLDYLEQAIIDLKNQPNIDTTCIGLLGYSRGAELALLMASKYPELKFVIGFVPSHAVFGSYPAIQGFQKSAWTFKGEELPYLSNSIHANYLQNSHVALRSENAVQKTKDYLETIIPVENINGPVLLFSGGDDQLWASSWMADQIIRRLESNNHPHKHQHVKFEEAGHIFSDHDVYTKYGGSVKANTDAHLQAWREVNRFLDEIRASRNQKSETN